jgi:hypothetical protein
MSGALDAERRAREFGACRLVPKPLDLDDVKHALRFVGCCKARPVRPSAPGAPPG